MKAKLQPVTEDTTTCPESPCLPDGLSPFKKTFPDIISCMSPKRRKLQNDRTSSPLPPPRQRKRGVASISVDYSSSPVPKRLTRRPLSESEYSQVGGFKFLFMSVFFSMFRAINFKFHNRF